MTNAAVFFPKPVLGELIAKLRDSGRRVVGPTMGDGAIVYDEVRSLADLPSGWIDEQEAGRYRLHKTGSDRWFDFVVGPHSWKKYLFPPKLDLLRVTKTAEGFDASEPDFERPQGPTAFLGVRACELAAIGIQDTVFLGGPFIDKHYKIRRDQAFIVAVNCVRPGGTCFCASMKTGPKAKAGYDVALTELEDGFLAEAATEAGEGMLASLPCVPADPDRSAEAARLLEASAQNMGRTMVTEGLPELLMENLDHPRWDDVAARCLSCANCTMVCPTCFCSDVEDVNDLLGDASTRVRVWDSCFALEFAHMHGGGRRPTIKDRYRQWLTHKLSTWTKQFGTSGCVGCGRCITWCPPGIDLTVEAAALRLATIPGAAEG